MLTALRRRAAALVASAAVAASITAAILAIAPPAASADAVRGPTAWYADLAWSGKERVAHATRARKATVERLFASAGVAWPAKEVLLRVYKDEGEVEVWAGDGAAPLRRVATYGICAASGELGPKRAEGDLQVPEGFYAFGYFHPESAYYLSALVDYPNRSDRIRGAAAPGGQIMMHGRCASIGCLAMTDERIEEIYLTAWSSWLASGKKPQVHIFPGRDFDALLGDSARAAHHAFWREIRAGHDAFEATRRIPAVAIADDGRYVITHVR